ncbi:MAG: heavy metal translocating P-type ATPase [Elusimicrobiales bacterium]|nr:heavy metal translocating P-type ATPase [Elusimicrobiales bacterium]
MPDKIKLVMPLEGVHCASCVMRIERVVAAIGGVESVSVHLPTRTAYITYDTALTGPDEIKAVIERLGYKVLEVSEQSGPRENLVILGLEREAKMYLSRFLGAAALSVFILSAGYFSLSPYTVWLAATVVWAWCAAHFHAGFLRASRALSPDMNTLVSMSATTAYAYSAALAAFPGLLPAGSVPLWADMALLVTFINFGRWLESRSKKSAGSAILRLMRMAPRFARIVENGKEKTVRAALLRPGQVFLVSPGEQFPADGEVLTGVSSADESLLTGESLPADKMPGSRVFGGTINKQGALACRATGTGENTALSKIIEAVRRSQIEKAPVEHMVDRISYYFVPAVFVVAVAAGLLWMKFGGADSFSRGISVFVAVLAVACPCAMGLAVPMAVAVGFDRAAGMGVLIRNSEALERAGGLGVVVLDKTGTLTMGDIAVEKVLPEGCSEDFLLRHALMAESASEHPFAEAVRKYCAARGIAAQRPDSAQAYPGLGIKASFGAAEILAGKPEWLAANGVKLPPETGAAHSRSVVAVAAGGAFLGRILLSDRLRPSAKAAVERLRGMGLEVALVSGDRKEAVASAAAQAGIREFYGEVLPEEKARLVAELQGKGRRAAMVGDGFNDAPALSRADIGIAFSSGTDVAVEAADMVLVRPSLDAVGDAIVLSRLIMRVIRQNLFWAFFYNIVLIPMAAGAFYPWTHILVPPSLAAAAMALSSVSVVLNSLRLRSMKL